MSFQPRGPLRILFRLLRVSSAIHLDDQPLLQTDRFARSETERQPGRGESQGWDEQLECMLKYVRIPSTAGTRDPERSRFFHKLSRQHTAENPLAGPQRVPQRTRDMREGHHHHQQRIRLVYLEEEIVAHGIFPVPMG
ncbi:MAG: hypothetical protein ACREVY_09000 [Gammaproteobacteria bacterium]